MKPGFITSTLLLVLALVLVLATPVHAATHGIDCSISLTVDYWGDKTHSLEGYSKNTFLMRDAEGRYVLAEYNTKDECYIVTGFTEDEAAANLLRCGNCSERPGELVIMGLPIGTYSLSHVETEDGWLKVSDEVTISVFENGPAQLKIILLQPTELPGFDKPSPLTTVIGVALMLFSVMRLLILYFIDVKEKQPLSVNSSTNSK